MISQITERWALFAERFVLDSYKYSGQIDSSNLVQNSLLDFRRYLTVYRSMN